MKREKLIRARIKKGLSQKVAAELLGVSRNTWSLWELGKEDPYPVYVEKLCTFFNIKEPSDLNLEPPQLRTEQAQKRTSSHTPPQPLHTQTSFEVYDCPQQFLPQHSRGQVTFSSLFPQTSDIIGEGDRSEELEENAMDEGRRQLIRDAISVTSTAIITPASLLEQFARVLTMPSTVDAATLSYLETKTADYWRDRHGARASSSLLLTYALEHLQKILTFLERSLLLSERRRLCALASGTSQLVGHLFFDLSDYDTARNFHWKAIKAAQEADHPALEAVAWGRMSFTWTYNNNPQEALSCIQKACSVAAGKTSEMVQAYLSAVEAEVQALLHDREASLKALDRAENTQLEHTENHYWLRFDRSRLEGYRGTCFRRFYSPGDPTTVVFLTQAQNTLKDALARLSPSMMQRRPALLIDLASTYTQQREIREACELAIQAIIILAQLQSRTGVKRLSALQQELAPWNDTSYVKNVDEHIQALLVPG